MRQPLAALLLGLIVTLPQEGRAGDAEAPPSREVIMQQLAQVAQPDGKRSAAERLHRLFDLSWTYAMVEHPEFATAVGYPGVDDRWTDNSLAAIDRRHDDQRRFLAALESIDRDQLTPDDQLNFDLFKRNLTEEIEGFRFPEHLMPLSQLEGPYRSIPALLESMKRRHARDFAPILARLATVDRVVEQTIELMKAGLEKGVTPPRVTLASVADQIRPLTQAGLEDNPLGVPFRELPEGLEPADRERIRTRAAELIRDVAAPAFKQLSTFFEETYLPRTVREIGLSALPDGAAWYAYRVRRSTTTDLSAEEIHELGLREVARIRGEMDELIASTGFEGDFRAFVDMLRTDPRFTYTEADDLLRGYRDIAKRIDPHLVELFGFLSRLPYGVEPVPAHTAPAQTTAYYEPGSLRAGRPGIFRANTYNLAARPTWEMEALTLHEAVPGHHLQISIAQELDSLPLFRRYGRYTAYIEGWALYAESLGEEMGMYRDPYSKFGQLTYEMWRALRLVVDTGLHVMGWTRQQARDFFRANTGKTDHDIAVEVDRYLVWPAQALAYKIGELRIKSLRRKAEESLGERFDIRRFHDEILGQGALPLDVLSRRIEAWIEAERAGSETS